MTNSLIDHAAFKTALEWNKGQTYSDSKTAFEEFLNMYLNQAKKRQHSAPKQKAGDVVCIPLRIGHDELDTGAEIAYLKPHGGGYYKHISDFMGDASTRKDEVYDKKSNEPSSPATIQKSGATHD